MIKWTSPLTRSHKQNDRNHVGIANGTATAEEHLPRFFGKHGHADSSPNSSKKNGAGRGNWGMDGEEIQDAGFNLTNARRRSNSSSYAAGLKDFKTKFEARDEDPVFEEELHGTQSEDGTLSRTETSESVTSTEDGKSVDANTNKK